MLIQLSMEFPSMLFTSPVYQEYAHKLCKVKVFDDFHVKF